MITPITNHNISSVNFTSNNFTDEQRKKQEQVAAGIGGAAGVGAVTSKIAGKSSIKVTENGEHILQNMMGTVKQTANTINQSSKAATGLWAKFKFNIRMYSSDIMSHLSKFKNSKYIGPIVNSPITKKASFIAGGVLAFFVLATGLNKAINDGSIAVNDLKNQYYDFKYQ